MMRTPTDKLIEAFLRFMEWFTIELREIGNCMTHLHGFAYRIVLGQENFSKLVPSGYGIGR